MSEPGLLRIERHVPLGLVFAVLIQTAGLVWWGANVSNRVTTVENDLLRLRAEMGTMRDGLQARGERIASLEAGQAAILSALRRIDAKLDAIRP